MKRIGCDYESLNDTDRLIYDKLKQQYEEHAEEKNKHFINNLPKWAIVAHEKFADLFTEISRYFCESGARFAFGEFRNVFEYRLYCVLYRALCKELRLRHCAYVEPHSFNVENFLGAETVGLFSGMPIDARLEGSLSNLLWERLNPGYYTFVFTVQHGPRYSKFSTSIQDYFPNFQIDQEKMMVSFKDKSWNLK